MHWQEAVIQSPVKLAYRRNNLGNILDNDLIMVRRVDGFTYLNLPTSIKPLTRGEAEGFDDWEPVKEKP